MDEYIPHNMTQEVFDGFKTAQKQYWEDNMKVNNGKKELEEIMAMRKKLWAEVQSSFSKLIEANSTLIELLKKEKNLQTLEDNIEEALKNDKV